MVKGESIKTRGLASGILEAEWWQNQAYCHQLQLFKNIGIERFYEPSNTQVQLTLTWVGSDPIIFRYS
jgi:hypothetical protein